MRDFRDAKAMAQTLRQALTTKSVDITQSESLELVARILGLRSWNVLAARIQAEGPPPARAAAVTVGLPVLPIRDLVVFPQMTAVLYAGRARTIRAVDQAMAADQRVLLVAQRQADVDDPGEEALHRIGVIARVLEALKLPNGSVKVTVQALERARITGVVKGELLQATHEPTGEGEPDDRSKALTKSARERFGELANVDLSAPPHAMAGLAYARDPGVLADLMVQHLSVTLDQAQDLLETADPADRLEKLLEIMQSGRKAA